MKHRCHVPSCPREVPRMFLMCTPHWQHVPRPLQEAVRNTFQHGQERGLVRPSPEWFKAARAAIESVTDRFVGRRLGMQIQLGLEGRYGPAQGAG